MSETSYPLHKIKVVLLENIHQDAVERFEAAGFTVEHHTRAYNGEELAAIVADAHIVGVRSKSHLTAEVLAHAKRLWAIGCFCIGTNQVDLKQAAAQGVTVFNAPFSNTRSVAELVISEIVALHRQLFDRSAAMHRGEWRKSAVGAEEIRGKVLGIVGYGRIGSQVSILAEAMGMKVRFYDVVDVLPLGNAQPVRSLHELIAMSDVVSLHVPATEGTKNLIMAPELDQMKRGAYLLNNARGTVVDVEALAERLKDGRIGGAAVDVFPAEPASNAEPFHSVLRGLDNVILTPHIGGSTVQAQRHIADTVSSRLIRLMNNGTTSTAVNVPEVQLPLKHPGCHRVLHFHRNVPGVLSQINQAISDLGANVVAQHLQTDPKHAYVILDVEGEYGEQLKDRLGEIDATIRVRALW